MHSKPHFFGKKIMYVPHALKLKERDYKTHSFEAVTFYPQKN